LKKLYLSKTDGELRKTLHNDITPESIEIPLIEREWEL
jgi:hypothetical protein